MSKREAQAQATRETLLRVGHQLFAEHGYAAVGTEMLVERAGLTRGALYHHFRDKRELFAAVHEELEQRLSAEVGTAIADLDDPVVLMRTGVRAFLGACTAPDVVQIALVDAPTVLGWAAWREVSERFGLGLITAGLQLAIEAGALRPQPVRPLAHLILGALGEAALLIANAEDRARARDEMEPALLNLLDGLMHPAGGRAG